MKYEFFSAEQPAHFAELEQFHAADDAAAQAKVAEKFKANGETSFIAPVVSNPAALYGRSWFVAIPDRNTPFKRIIGYLYTTGRPDNAG